MHGLFGNNMLNVSEGGRKLPGTNRGSETAHRAPVSPSTDTTTSVPESRALCHHPHSLPGESQITTQEQSQGVCLLSDHFKFNSSLFLQHKATFCSAGQALVFVCLR